MFVRYLLSKRFQQCGADPGWYGAGSNEKAPKSPGPELPREVLVPWSVCAPETLENVISPFSPRLQDSSD